MKKISNVKKPQRLSKKLWDQITTVRSPASSQDVTGRDSNQSNPNSGDAQIIQVSGLEQVVEAAEGKEEMSATKNLKYRLVNSQSVGEIRDGPLDGDDSRTNLGI